MKFIAALATASALRLAVREGGNNTNSTSHTTGAHCFYMASHDKYNTNGRWCHQEGSARCLDNSYGGVDYGCMWAGHDGKPDWSRYYRWKNQRNNYTGMYSNSSNSTSYGNGSNGTDMTMQYGSNSTGNSSNSYSYNYSNGTNGTDMTMVYSNSTDNDTNGTYTCDPANLTCTGESYYYGPSGNSSSGNSSDNDTNGTYTCDPANLTCTGESYYYGPGGRNSPGNSSLY